MESKLKCVFDLQFIEVNENSDNNKDSNLGSLTNSTKSEDLGIGGGGEQSISSTVYVKVIYQTNLEPWNLNELNFNLSLIF